MMHPQSRDFDGGLDDKRESAGGNMTDHDFEKANPTPTIKQLLSEVRGRADRDPAYDMPRLYEHIDRVELWSMAKVAERSELRRLADALEVMDEALTCNETFHNLGGIDDCEPCKARVRAAKILSGEG
jgi:hypothetical protein